MKMEIHVARAYELMVVLSGEVEEGDVPERISGLRTLVGDHGGTVTEVIDWGRRRLAYPIRNNFEGHYLITEFNSEDGAGNAEVERVLRIDETVLRHLMLRKDD
jgi:small subunit ribosomal protein S6